MHKAAGAAVPDQVGASERRALKRRHVAAALRQVVRVRIVLDAPRGCPSPTPAGRCDAQHGAQVAQAVLQTGMRPAGPARRAAAVFAAACRRGQGDRLRAARHPQRPDQRWSLPSCVRRSSPAACRRGSTATVRRCLTRMPSSRAASLLDLPPRPRLRRQGRSGAGPVRRVFQGEALGPGEYVISADEKTSIQARYRCHPTCHQAGPGSCGSSTSTSAAARCLSRRVGRPPGALSPSEPTTGIEPFDGWWSRS